ncbi:hypothetical protein CIY_00170 [Butyrivibrio fibrisolvens 16/4]|nr:hypothetical protein CIY_00170 [Butyrivibrio fibrisolvens 16/4]
MVGVNGLGNMLNRYGTTVQKLKRRRRLQIQRRLQRLLKRR